MKVSSVLHHYLEVEDDGPDQTKDDGWPSVCDVGGVNVYKFDLKQKGGFPISPSLRCFCQSKKAEETG